MNDYTIKASNSIVKTRPVQLQPRQKTKVAGNTSMPEIDKLSSVTNDSGVKVPMSYVKTGEIDLPYELKAHCYRLGNGQRVVILPKEGETIVKTYVNTGSMNEPDHLRGISHYIEHNLFNGAEGLSAGEFFDKVNKMGAFANASTGFAETNYFISSHLLNDDDLENKIKLHASMLETPKFESNMLEKEKGIVNSEINMTTSNPENMVYNLTVKNLFNIKSSSKDVIAGSTDNITNLTRKDVVDYYDKNYYPANMVTVVSGEVEPDKTIRLVSKYFTSRKQPPKERYNEKLEPIANTVRQDIMSDKTHSTLLAMGFVGPSNNDVKGAVLTNALCKLIFESAEAKSGFNELNADINAEIDKIGTKQSTPGAIVVTGEVSEENSEKLLKNIYSRILRYQNTPLNEAEMKILKRDLRQNFEEIFEHSCAINNFIGEKMLRNTVSSIMEEGKIIDSLTPADIQAAARKYFPLDKTSIAVLHPQDTDKKQLIQNYNAINSAEVTFCGTRHQEVTDLSKVNQYKLPNNYTVLTNDIRYPSSRLMISYDIPKGINVPSIYYDVLGKILDSGTASKSEKDLKNALETDGIRIATVANKRVLSVFAGFDTDSTDKAFGYVEEILRTPRFTEEEFQKAVNDVKDSILRSAPTPMDKLRPEIYNDSRLKKEEVLKTLDNLTLQDIQDLYEKIFNTSSGVVTLSSRFSKNPELKNKLLNRVLTYQPTVPFKYSPEENYVPQNEVKVFTQKDSKNQAKIQMVYKFKNSENIKDEAALNLLNIILGGGPSSRLFNDLREKQKLAYSVGSEYVSRGDIGFIRLGIGTTTDNKETKEQSFDNVQKSINGFRNHIDKLLNEDVTEEELTAAKLALKNSILDDKESTIDQTINLTSSVNSPYGILHDNLLLDTADSITVKDIRTAAKNIFSTKPTYSIVATEDTLSANEDYLKTLGKLES